jgi:hypothetical protein
MVRVARTARAHPSIAILWPHASRVVRVAADRDKRLRRRHFSEMLAGERSRSPGSTGWRRLRTGNLLLKCALSKAVHFELLSHFEL